MYQITPELIAELPQNGPTDPIEFYRRPLVGHLYRERINRGLGLLGQRRFNRALEVGYGSGAVQLALAPGVEELHGVDLDADPAVVSEIISKSGFNSQLRRGNVYELPYDDQHFDLVVCFSVMEHLSEYPKALGEIHRVLKPGGTFLLGMPSVNRLMEMGFLAIGFKGINDHHVTTPGAVAKHFDQSGFGVEAERHLDFPSKRPLGLRLYYNWLVQRGQ